MWATRPRGNPPSVVRWPTKPGPSPRLRDDDSLGQEPRWNAGRRARPAGRAPRLSTGAVVRTCVFRRSASFFFSAGKRKKPEAPKKSRRTGNFGQFAPKLRCTRIAGTAAFIRRHEGPRTGKETFAGDSRGPSRPQSEQGKQHLNRR